MYSISSFHDYYRFCYFLFLVLISVRGWVDPSAIVRLEVLGKLKKEIHLIGTRTRDLLACSIVPQQTTPPRARHFRAGKGRPVRKADNLTAICEPIV
jgi:hypothetical protein